MDALPLMLRPTSSEITERNNRQRSVLAWAREAFAKPNNDLDEVTASTRLQRFFEEAVELAQAGGITKDMLLKQIEVTFARPSGEVYQELGGCMVTLMAFSEAMHYSLALAEHDEISRCNDKDPAHFQRRQQEKRKDGL